MVLLGGGLASGCASHADRLESIRDSFYTGEVDVAVEQIDKHLERNGADSEVLLLDRAVAELFSGSPVEAENMLRRVRDRFDHLEQGSLGEEAVSLLSDDNRRAYAGEDYEKVLVRAFLALSNLMGDGEDAVAYTRQVAQKQQEILASLEREKAPGSESSVVVEASSSVPVRLPTPGVQGPIEVERAGSQQMQFAATSAVTTRNGGPQPLAPGNSAAVATEIPAAPQRPIALGPYLEAIIQERTHRDYQEAARSRARVVSWQPEFPFGASDLERARNGRHSAPGHGVLYVFALVGRGPYKVERAEIPTTAALAIADQILTSTTSYRLPPTIAPVKVPALIRQPGPIRHVQVDVGGNLSGTTATITDVGGLAEQAYNAVYPRIVARAVVRRVVKKGLVASGGQQIDGDGDALAKVATDVAGVVWEAAESADTRCWGLLPDKIQVARFEVPAGNHQVSLTGWGDAGPLAAAHEISVEIRDGRDAYLMAFLPDSQPVGEILVGPQFPGEG